MVVSAPPAGAPQRGKASARFRPERRTQHNRQHNQPPETAMRRARDCPPYRFAQSTRSVMLSFYPNGLFQVTAFLTLRSIFPSFAKDSGITNINIKKEYLPIRFNQVTTTCSVSALMYDNHRN